MRNNYRSHWLTNRR